MFRAFTLETKGWEKEEFMSTVQKYHPENLLFDVTRNFNLSRVLCLHKLLTQVKLVDKN